jgi:hypothetical protein
MKPGTSRYIRFTPMKFEMKSLVYEQQTFYSQPKRYKKIRRLEQGLFVGN